MKVSVNDFWIIFLFALLHGVVTFIARVVGFHDELLITMLTMIMSIILSMRRNVNTAFMIVAIIAVNFLGLWLGKNIGSLMRNHLLPPSPLRPYLSGPLATFLTTLILGALQTGAAVLVRRIRGYREPEADRDILVITAIITILIVRLSMLLREPESFMVHPEMNILINYIFSFVTVLLMTLYVLSSKRKAEQEKKQRFKVAYEYERFKQQISPHFLFNSLNSLNAIVMSGHTEAASLFIHRLSGIYRYLIENESERTVYLEDEIRFVNMYLDLMKVRFPEGLEVDIEIGKEDLRKFIIPCSIQLLVENATKHNAISSGKPLRIRITVEDGWVRVTNNLNPKISSQPSTGNGLRYIRHRYYDDAGKEIIVLQDEHDYTVKLPLLLTP